MTHGNLRLALFPCTYREIDGVANTSRQFAAFAKERGFAVPAGPRGPARRSGNGWINYQSAIAPRPRQISSRRPS